jgi:hypothetical protein
MLCPVRTGIFLLALGLAAAATAGTTTYRWVDADGVHYSDQPHPGAEQITLGKAPTYSAADTQPSTPSRSPASNAPSQDNASFKYDSCAITQPANDQMLMNTDSVNILVQPQPFLRNGDHVVLTLDAQTIDLGGAGQQQFQMSPANRGTHTVSAAIMDPNGNSLCQSLALKFHVQQPRLRPIPTPH